MVLNFKRYFSNVIPMVIACHDDVDSIDLNTSISPEGNFCFRTYIYVGHRWNHCCFNEYFDEKTVLNNYQDLKRLLTSRGTNINKNITPILKKLIPFIVLYYDKVDSIKLYVDNVCSHVIFGAKIGADDEEFNFNSYDTEKEIEKIINQISVFFGKKLHSELFS